MHTILDEKITSRVDKLGASKLCREDGCEKPSWRRGLCRWHAKYWDERRREVCSEYTYLYAIATADRSAVKFGISAEPTFRLQNISVGCPVDLELVGAVFASETVEKLVHDLLSEYHLRGEWFRPEGKAKELMDALATNEFHKVYDVIDSL